MLSTQLHYLVRLLLASGTPELHPEPAGLPARLDALWQRVHTLVQAYHRVGQGQAGELTEQMLSTLLGEDCCRQAVCRVVSLPQALGLTRVLHRMACQHRARRQAQGR